MERPVMFADYQTQLTPTYTGSISSISEPEIIASVNNEVKTPIGGGLVNTQQTEVLTQQGYNATQSNINMVAQSNTDKESSATTDETKTYVGGGTTPDSKIVIDKPSRNYIAYSLLGIVGVYVVYKVFFKKN